MIIQMEVVNLENAIPKELMAALSEDHIKEVMETIMDGARAEWIRLAGTELHTTKTEYIKGIMPVEWRNETTAAISLVGLLPNLLEQGMPRTDMHETLLGPNAKGKHPKKGGGWYRAIPFRHYTPGAGAHGVQMGKPYAKMLGAEGAKQLGTDVYKAAKKLGATTSNPYGKTTWGERLDTSQITRRNKNVYVPKLKSHHKSDIYKGMVRQEKTYGKATQSQYTTFRTISTGSDGWIRRRTEGKFLAKQVVEFVNTKLAPQAFQAYVNSLK